MVRAAPDSAVDERIRTSVPFSEIPHTDLAISLFLQGILNGQNFMEQRLRTAIIVLLGIQFNIKLCVLNSNFGSVNDEIRSGLVIVYMEKQNL